MKRSSGKEASPDSRRPYAVQSVLRACELLRSFQFEEEALPLSELSKRAKLNKTTAFRLLRSLEMGGLVERVGVDRYRTRMAPVRRPGFRIGYAAQTSEFSFTRDVTQSVRQAAEEAGLDLVVLDNRYSPKTALKNAERFVKEGVDLVIEFQTFHAIAAELASKLQQAKIPLIAISVPHPDAVFYGANNYEAGRIGGRALVRWAKRQWAGKVDELLLLDLPAAGPLVQSRIAGIAHGVGGVLPRPARTTHLDSKGRYGVSLEAVREHLRRSRSQRVLIGAINDPSALGALRAFEEAGRARWCAVVGQNASFEARVELRKPETRLIGSVAYFPENYGRDLIRLALDILRGKEVAPAHFVKHVLITASNVDRYYPNDTLHDVDDLEPMLLRSP